MSAYTYDIYVIPSRVPPVERYRTGYRATAATAGAPHHDKDPHCSPPTATHHTLHTSQRRPTTPHLAPNLSHSHPITSAQAIARAQPSRPNRRMGHTRASLSDHERVCARPWPLQGQVLACSSSTYSHRLAAATLPPAPAACRLQISLTQPLSCLSHTCEFIDSVSARQDKAPQ